MQTAQSYRDHGHGASADQLSLTYEDRFLRRKVLRTEGGGDLLVDLPKTVSLAHGGVLITLDGDEVAILAADEPLLEVRGDLVRLAWHIGNRHTPCQMDGDRLLILRDAVLADMLTRLGAETREVFEPFTPEGGAYGMGRTHSHHHGDQHAHG